MRTVIEAPGKVKPCVFTRTLATAATAAVLPHPGGPDSTIALLHGSGSGLCPSSSESYMSAQVLRLSSSLTSHPLLRGRLDVPVGRAHTVDNMVLYELAF